eukprot:469546-Rhodomonas_salina.1
MPGTDLACGASTVNVNRSLRPRRYHSPLLSYGFATWCPVLRSAMLLPAPTQPPACEGPLRVSLLPPTLSPPIYSYLSTRTSRRATTCAYMPLHPRSHAYLAVLFLLLHHVLVPAPKKNVNFGPGYPEIPKGAVQNPLATKVGQTELREVNGSFEPLKSQCARSGTDRRGHCGIVCRYCGTSARTGTDLGYCGTSARFRRTTGCMTPSCESTGAGRTCRM